MDRQEITAFTELYIKFQERCKHIAKILSEYDCDFEESKFNNWELDYVENKFECYTTIGLYARDCLIFPIELLSANDNQIHLYAQEKYKK